MTLYTYTHTHIHTHYGPNMFYTYYYTHLFCDKVLASVVQPSLSGKDDTLAVPLLEVLS